MNRAWTVLLAASLCAALPCAAQDDFSIPAFVAGCAEAIVQPAKQSYAARAAEVGNPSPKPFPERQVRDSVEPMCACIGQRLVDAGLVSAVAADPSVVKPMVEALAGGRCKPGGILGDMLAGKKKK